MWCVKGSVTKMKDAKVKDESPIHLHQQPQKQTPPPAQCPFKFTSGARAVRTYSPVTAFRSAIPTKPSTAVLEPRAAALRGAGALPGLTPRSLKLIALFSLSSRNWRNRPSAGSGSLSEALEERAVGMSGSSCDKPFGLNFCPFGPANCVSSSPPGTPPSGTMPPAAARCERSMVLRAAQ